MDKFLLCHTCMHLHEMQLEMQRDTWLQLSLKPSAHKKMVCQHIREIKNNFPSLVYNSVSVVIMEPWPSVVSRKKDF